MPDASLQEGFVVYAWLQKLLPFATEFDALLELKTRATDDELVLARVPPRETLAATIAAAELMER